ncbi:glycoside hydrolase 61 [Neurospora sp. IMI 360204]|nr:glycoside hydrolase 61 [Neurospora sp. IMI 360204]
MARKSILTALAGASLVAAHGHVSKVIVNGVEYQNYDPTSFPYNSNPPTVIGWTIDQKDNGFVSPDAFGTGDIICHKSATPAGGHATVKAGDKISLQWDQWPDSHKGPVIDYLAACDGECEKVDKTALEFFKIDGAGYDNGVWASDTLIKDGNSWLVQIPEDLKPGNYVLRHEIIALHSGGQANGAQNYPQCFNLKVEGSGSNLPSGVPGTELYKATDAGILFDIYKSDISYPVPGPSLIAGAKSAIQQSTMAATATASATVPGGAGAGATGGSPATTTAAAGVTTTAAAGATTSSQAQAPTTTLVTSTKAATTASAPASSQAQATTTATSGPASGGSGSDNQAAQTKWGQCGGNGWTGPTACVSGSTCQKQNDWYSQCL